MVILGISGFENIRSSSLRTPFYSSRDDVRDLLTFSGNRVPLQFFPLHLIGHDSAAALIENGRLIACAAEERFSRIKHAFNLTGQTVLPRNAIRYCLKEAGIRPEQIDYIAHYCDFTLKTVQERLDQVASGLNPVQYSIIEEEYQSAYSNRLSREAILSQLNEIMGFHIPESRFIPVRHHLAHAAGAYYSSKFNESLILTIDGYGEKESLAWALGENDQIHLMGSVQLPSSLGVLYQIMTAYLGFRSFGDEYKVMGLASYGHAGHFMPAFNEMVELIQRGHFCTRQMTRPDLYLFLEDLFGKPFLKGEYHPKAADIAAALQRTLEHAVLHVLTRLKKEYPSKNLCLSGGVSLNACMNGAVTRSNLFRRIFVQPAAADDGAGLGAAFYALFNRLGESGKRQVKHVFWGPKAGPSEIESACAENQKTIVWNKVGRIEERAAELLVSGKIIGWFQGRMEMGPRALGARCILADPRSLRIREILNKKIKGRESFRPFGPSVLKEECSRIFHVPSSWSSPFMLFVFPVFPQFKDTFPAVLHVDQSARLQTVSLQDHKRFYLLIRHFYRKTGVPLILNTSFNRAGEPIVCTPTEAIRCFLACRLDALCMEDFLIIPKNNRMI